jgi:TonB C terminal
MAGLGVSRYRRRFDGLACPLTAMAIGWGIVVGWGATAAAVELERGRPPEGRVDFDIPAQPLSAAIDAYATASGVALLYEQNVVAGIRSNAVSGPLVPDAALRLLLQGTGLQVLYAAPNTFTLVPGAASRANGLPLEYVRYYAAIQSDVENAFCRRRETRPGPYQVAIRFWIAPSGDVRQPELLNSTEDIARDRAVIDQLHWLRIREPPPPNMPQPVTMMIAPRPPEATGDCGFPAPIDPRQAARQTAAGPGR